MRVYIGLAISLNAPYLQTDFYENVLQQSFAKAGDSRAVTHLQIWYQKSADSEFTRLAVELRRAGGSKHKDIINNDIEAVDIRQEQGPIGPKVEKETI